MLEKFVNTTIVQYLNVQWEALAQQKAYFIASYVPQTLNIEAEYMMILSTLYAMENYSLLVSWLDKLLTYDVNL